MLSKDLDTITDILNVLEDGKWDCFVKRLLWLNTFAAAQEVEECIQIDMEYQYNKSWSIHWGFHAVPSLDGLHLHIISTDLISDKLKHKKQWDLKISNK